jgi:3-hydroxyacyl-[acyl-carrier-protein] dehydratase
MAGRARKTALAPGPRAAFRAAMPMDPAVTALIPHRPPFLFVDRILAESAEGLIAERTWRADEDFFKGHYPGAPITPGVLLCEAVFQTGALYMAKQAAATGAKPGEGVPLLSKISDVRFRTPIFPGDTIHIEVKKKEVIAGFTMMTGHVKKADGTRVLNVDFTVAWKTPEPKSV